MSIVNALKRSVLLILPILGLWMSGCAFQQSESTRAASFCPYADGKLGEVDIETYLSSRVALLISSGQNPTNLWAAGDMRVPGGGNLGCAAAIDRRGYFLTAAHCLKHEFVYLIFQEAQTTRALRARVVWRGNPREGEPDLAVLHVRGTLAQAFDWTEKVRSDGSAIAVGLSWSKKELRGFALLGGRILGCQESVGETGSLQIANDVPLQSGDSGGPLADAEGRLIGINTKATPPFVHWLLPDRVLPMIAERPDLKWLGELIRDDVAKQQSSAPFITPSRVSTSKSNRSTPRRGTSVVLKTSSAAFCSSAASSTFTHPVVAKEINAKGEHERIRDWQPMQHGLKSSEFSTSSSINLDIIMDHPWPTE